MSSRASTWALRIGVIFVAMHPSCAASVAVSHPTFADGGLLRGTIPLSEGALTTLGGFYDAVQTPERFGAKVVVHPTRSTLSIFGERSGGYAILKAGCLGRTQVVLEGAWRYPRGTDTGLVRLFVEPPALAHALCTDTKIPVGAIELRGSTGIEYSSPNQDLILSRTGPLVDLSKRFFVVGHRGACRTIDDCGVSENSVEGIRLAPSFGANVVELDVALSSDVVPFIFHDEAFGPRLTTGAFCHGSVSSFPLSRIHALCTLRYGEQIPTLKEALNAALETSELDGVWLDIKEPAAIAPVVEIVRQYRAVAAERKRELRIVIGLGSADLRDAFAAAVPTQDLPCLSELEISDVRQLNCRVWGPRWTRGPMANDVAAMQAEGRSVAFWTIDEPEYIDLFLERAKPNAIVSDRPTLVYLHAQLHGAALRMLQEPWR